MNCRKCGGRVFVDRLYPQDKRIELACLICGKRWFLHKREGKVFTKWLDAKEKQRRRASATST